MSNKKTKVLLIAYACEPNKGSEPGIGWDWIRGLSEFPLDITVLTRHNNSSKIEKEIEKLGMQKVRFIYYDLPQWVQKIKKKFNLVKLYYILWLFFSKNIINKSITLNNTDLIHHLTFSTDWLPFFYLINIKIHKIIGPLGGYKLHPNIYNYLSILEIVKCKSAQLLRNFGVAINFIILNFFSKNTILLSNNASFTSDYKAYFSEKKISNISTQLILSEKTNKCSNKKDIPIKILFSGRLLPWKGVEIVLEVFSKLKEENFQFQGIIIGNGRNNKIKKIKKYIADHQLSEIVDFSQFLPQKDFFEQLKKSTFLLYPSHYSTADSTIMEAVENNTIPIMLPTWSAFEFLGYNYSGICDDFKISSIVSKIKTISKARENVLLELEEIKKYHYYKNKLNKVYNIYSEIANEKY